MAIGDDFSISATGDIRHTSGTTVYTVLELHEWLQDLADDAASTGDDNLDILAPNPSKLDGPRDSAVASRLNLLDDNGSISFNIDDTAAQYFNFGSIKQTDAFVQYSGLRTIGGIVANSPVYVVQKSDKITSFWSNGHIQILVKVKTANALVDGGDVTAFSRKWAQTYSHFDVNLAAGGETSAAISTALDANIVDTESDVLTNYVPNVALSFGDTTQDLGNGNGNKLYKGTITLSNNITLANAYQALQYLTRESSTSTINTIDGWRYRALIQDGTGTITVTLADTAVTGVSTLFTTETAVGRKLYDTNGDLIGTVASITSDTALTLERGALVAVSGAGYKTSLGYTENVAAPFGTFAGGTFFFAQGWYVTGVRTDESTSYQLTAHDGTLQNPPNIVAVTVGSLVSGDYVLVAREDGAGGVLTDEYTPVAASSGATSLTIVESIKNDTPTSGVIRIKGGRYEYSSFNASTKTFTLTTGLTENIVAADDVFVPYIDQVTTATSLSKSFKYDADFDARVDVRRGSGANPIIPFDTKITITSAGASVNASRNSDI